MRKIVETTDGKYIGKTIDETDIQLEEGVSFSKMSEQNLGNGYFRYFNSSYVILTKEVK